MGKMLSLQKKKKEGDPGTFKLSSKETPSCSERSHGECLRVAGPAHRVRWLQLGSCSTGFIPAFSTYTPASRFSGPASVSFWLTFATHSRSSALLSSRRPLEIRVALVFCSERGTGSWFGSRCGKDVLPHHHLKAGLPGCGGLGPSAELKALPPDAGLGKGRGLPSETSGADRLGPNIANWTRGGAGGVG